MARIKTRGLSALLWMAGILAAAGLPEKIQQTLDAATAVRRGFLGVAITDLSSGKSLFTSNADKLFVPASNSKLFTVALALTRLGPDRPDAPSTGRHCH